jgi:hypothetical protein
MSIFFIWSMAVMALWDFSELGSLLHLSLVSARALDL